LTIYVWSGVATFLGVASSQYLMAENLAQLSMYRTLLGMIANIALNLILIPAYGMIGSAIATLFSYFLATFGLVLFPQTRAHTVMLLRSLNVARHLVRR
jgi:Na+-driven multidrug efflux pump